MPLVTEYTQVKEAYAEAAERSIALPAFCSEDRETLEAILAAALKVSEEIGVPDLPIVPAWTGRYPARPQATLVSITGDAMLGSRLMLSDLKVFASECSPYRHLRILPHLDHAWPWVDGDLLALVSEFASVMCDGSARPFDENVRLTAEYVEQVKGKVVVEGAVDELPEAGDGSGGMELTTVAQAVRFVEETGVDMIVPNVGTEHRATAFEVRYNSDRAREISAAVGKIMCIHGTSSVATDQVAQLPLDGFVKVNVFTTLAVHGGQAVARRVLADIRSYFGEDDIAAMLDEGVLGSAAADGEPAAPRLKALATSTRRDAWSAAVQERCGDFLTAFGYERFAD